MKCDRRWYNDGRRELEGNEGSVRFWGCSPTSPFWLWWIVSDEAEAYRRAQASLTMIRIGGITSSGPSRRAGMSTSAAAAAVQNALGFDANGSPVE